ncbi:MAG TPA: ABC transporter ATP-binding protein [Spirochaetia bacterium]|nr:ABC transporter ATP-binding protein [Spirochaetia bacterium]
MKDFSRLIIQGVTKEFGDKVALADFSLELKQGEFVTFLGPSGCGKSTALNCIAGLIPMTRGRIAIDDETIEDSNTKIPAEKREFGMVFQNYALFPHLTVFNNVAFGLQIRHLSKDVIRERVREAIRLVHLEGYDEKFPSQMSGGEQQRVAIARCIVLEPRLLMLDEPLSNLDAKLRVEMRYELKALHERLHVTSIYVTHDQQEALALSDRVVVMRAGHIQQVGTPSQIYSDPANLFIADFMGFKNLWEGQVESLREAGNALEAEISVNGSLLHSRLRYGAGDPRRASLLAARDAKTKITTAIRPEDIEIDGASTPGALRAKVTLVEYLGQTSQVSAVTEGGTRIDLRTSKAVSIGDNVSLLIAPERLLLFSPESRAASGE